MKVTDKLLLVTHRLLRIVFFACETAAVVIAVTILQSGGHAWLQDPLIPVGPYAMYGLPAVSLLLLWFDKKLARVGIITSVLYWLVILVVPYIQS